MNSYIILNGNGMWLRQKNWKQHSGWLCAVLFLYFFLKDSANKALPALQLFESACRNFDLLLLPVLLYNEEGINEVKKEGIRSRHFDNAPPFVRNKTVRLRNKALFLFRLILCALCMSKHTLIQLS